MLRRVGEPVVGLTQLVRHQPSDHGVERAQRHEQNQQAAYGLQRTVDALDEYGKLEQPVQALGALRLFHAGEGQEPWVCSRPGCRAGGSNTRAQKRSTLISKTRTRMQSLYLRAGLQRNTCRLSYRYSGTSRPATLATGS